jgi:hypothetical protein
MQKTTLFLAAAMAIPLTPAVAQVPKLNIEKTCRAAQPLLGNDPAANTGSANDLGNAAQANPYKTCMQSEQAAQKSASDLWPKVKAADRTNCVGLSRMVYPSYVELLSCLQMYNPAASGIPANPTPTNPLPNVGRNRRP